MGFLEGGRVATQRAASRGEFCSGPSSLVLQLPLSGPTEQPPRSQHCTSSATPHPQNSPGHRPPRLLATPGWPSTGVAAPSVGCFGMNAASSALCSEHHRSRVRWSTQAPVGPGAAAGAGLSPQPPPDRRRAFVLNQLQVGAALRRGVKRSSPSPVPRQHLHNFNYLSKTGNNNSATVP